MQFYIGIICLRVEFGYLFFKFLGDQMNKFLNYANEGSALVFGVDFRDHFFAFGVIHIHPLIKTYLIKKMNYLLTLQKAMPVVIFFGSTVNLLFYFGFIQYLILKVSFVINFIIGTSPTESINSTANVFLGQVCIRNGYLFSVLPNLILFIPIFFNINILYFNNQILK